MILFKNLLFAGLISLTVASYAQSPKKYCKAAVKLEKTNNYDAAIENYSRAIELKPTYDKALIGRAKCYEKVNKKEEAIKDFKAAISVDPKDKTLYYDAGRLLASLGNYKEAHTLLQQAVEKDKKYTEAIAEDISVLLKLKDYTNGIKMTQMALDAKRNTSTLFAHAVMYDSLRNYVEAEKFYKSARASDFKFIPAHIGLALTQLKLNKADDAMKVCEEALVKDPNNMDVLFTKSLVDAAKKDYQSALNDITKVILSRPDAAAYKQRASFYIIMGQHQNAINDYSQVLLIDDTDVGAYLSRAAAFEHTMNYKAALSDYNKVAALSAGNESMTLVVKTAKKKIFDLSRESGKPEVELTSIKSAENTIRVSADRNEITIKGTIKDASPIKNIRVNSGSATFPEDVINPEFTVEVKDLTRLNELAFTVTDVYGNTQVTRYKIEKTESDKPIIAIETPIATFENEIFIDNTNPEVYVQGRIKDESNIESITIDGITAAFNPSVLNPQFSSTVKIADKNKITMVVRDVYGNENTQIYALNRSGATAGLDNPMGNTWVVFIENSKYQSFPSLEGPAKDVMAMRSALVNYKITKIIHKRDMTKVEMEKFFSIELRDYVRNNNVNSLLIWYAGHGKYVSPTGYWVPSDGKTDDEFSYFGINNLRAAMQAYAGKLIHTLVITDACESGATFLMAMRGGDEAKTCENFELTKAKSAQVFTSAGYELAADNSQFTKTFASSLNNNVEVCLPIEKIVKKVTVAVSNAGNQAPKFGKIKDMEDEGGTYFFIRK